MSNQKCAELHQIFNSMKRLSFPYGNEIIPPNGIYILFEQGEEAHDGNRIVRIGTHTGEGQLPSRLWQHFVNQNKDRSIFRKNIGRALLNRDNDDYLEKWELDLTTKENKNKYNKYIDTEYQNKIEERVSKKIQSDFSFVVFSVNDKNERLLFESRIISEVSNCSVCSPSDSWLGKHSPKQKIRESGLWLVNELYKQGFSDEEYRLFLRYVQTK